MATYEPPTVNVPELQKFLDGKYHDVRELTRQQLIDQAKIIGQAPDWHRDIYRDEVLKVVKKWAKTGSLGMGFPAAYGGGDDVGAAIAGFETLAFGDLSVLVKIGVQFGLFGGAILHLGTEKHHKTYLPKLIKGQLLGCFAMTETGHGSNVQEIETTATYDPEKEGFFIHTPTDTGRKDYIGNAAKHGQFAVVFAQLVTAGTEQGVHALVVPIRDKSGSAMPGVTITDDGEKLGLNGVDNGRIKFNQVFVPRTNLLDRYAQVSAAGAYTSAIENIDRRFFTMLGTLVQGRVCVGGGGISASKVALTIAIRYALKRRQFGDPGRGQEELLLDYGMHQRRLFPLLARSYALHFAQETLAAEMHEVFSATDEVPEKRRRNLESRAAATKALGTWHATKTIQECREACGGAGYLAENRFAALKADTDIFTTFEGDNTILLQLVAKGLLTDYSSAFGDLDQLGMVKFVANLAVETVVEQTAVHKLVERIKDILPGGESGWDQEAGLLDPQYHLAMLRFREEHMLSGVARRLKRGMDAKIDPVIVFSAVQDHVISCAKAHAERMVLEAFIEKTKHLTGDHKTALGLLCDLYALSTIESDRAWWMEHGRLTAQRSKAITAEINQLCQKIRPLAADFVAGFGIPDELVNLPLLAD